jgi:hypothetical protein
MDALVEELNTKLSQWQPDVAERVRQSLVELIELADRDLLDVGRSRSAEQDVLDVLDEPKTE